MGVLLETGKDSYQPTGFSKTLTEQKYSDAFPLMYTLPSPTPHPHDPY